MRKLFTMLTALVVGAGAFAATYGPWGESDAVKNSDKLGPTYLMNMPITINGTAAVQGDCVAVYRQDTSALCGLGKVLDGTGKITIVCYAPKDTVLNFKVWISSSGLDNPVIMDCSPDLVAPAVGSFHTGHALNANSAIFWTITYENLRDSTHGNPTKYQEGAVIAFEPPTGILGYSFEGWTPSGITANMTGNKTVQANWTAHKYTINYIGNGGSGEMAATAAVYNQAATIASNGFVYDGCYFRGWSTSSTGPVEFAAGDIVSNLTAVANGVVELYAIWDESTCLPDGGPYTEVVDSIEWTFTVANGEASVGGGNWNSPAVPTSTTGNITIPSMLGKCPVTSVGMGAFYTCIGLTSVTIPSGVTNIGNDAFQGCAELADVYFEGAAIDSIGEDAFSRCNWDMAMHVPNDWKGRWNVMCGYPVVRAGASGSLKIELAITNVVLQYVLNSIRPEIAVPVSSDTGFVTVVAEVKGSGVVSVPSEWKENYPTFATKFSSNFGKALTMKTGKKDGVGNEMFVWQDYVAGTDPTNPDDRFTASVTIVEGVPVISWNPELPAEQAALRKYTTYGKAKLQDAEWSVINGDESNYNFFKVTVEMK